MNGRAFASIDSACGKKLARARGRPTGPESPETINCKAVRVLSTFFKPLKFARSSRRNVPDKAGEYTSQHKIRSTLNETMAMTVLRGADLVI